VALRKEKVRSVVNLLGCTVETTSCEHVISADSWGLALLDTLLKLELRNVNPFDCTWFYFGESSCLHEPRECYRFFLVNASGIVAENAMLFFPGYGDQAPTYLQPLAPPERTWTGDDHEWRASVKDWYAEFYRTTHTGRVMVLREDNPPLFGLTRPEGAPPPSNSA
jgi:hypothetical protein